jgi:TonB family protein
MAARVRSTERHILIWMIVVFLLAYGISFIITYTRTRVPRADTVRRPVVHWMAPMAPVRQTEPHYATAEMFDPSLLSLPNRHGFSSALWQHAAAAEHRDLPPVLALAYGAPPTNFAVPVLLARAALPDLLRQTISALPSAAEPLELEPVVAGTQSVIHAEGPLADWPVLQQPDLPVLKRDGAVRPTVVRMAVNSAGVPLYVTLHRSSGDETVDAQALQLAREVAFVPRQALDATALTWGWLRFQWHTVAGNEN